MPTMQNTYEYLELRFNSLIRVICSLAFILFQVGRMGIVMYLPAIALNVITGFNIFLCIGLMGVLSLIYTMIGGIEAVVWTDALQVVILLGGAILVVIVAVFNTDINQHITPIGSIGFCRYRHKCYRTQTSTENTQSHRPPRQSSPSFKIIFRIFLPL